MFAVDLEGFAFAELDEPTQEQLITRFKRIFAGVEDVEVAVRRVETDGGRLLPVYVVAVSYRLPPGVPFGALAYEVGREFLGATPDNTSSFGDGQGVYMRGETNGAPTESVTFFIGKDVFVYVFGGSREAPTEDVARKLLEAHPAAD